MMWVTILLILLPVLWLALVWDAKEGYEDEDGFHFGRKKSDG